MNKNVKNKRKLKKSKANDDFREQNEILSSHWDPEGKVIFLNENITPTWLVAKLTSHFSSDQSRNLKSFGITA